MAQVDVVYDYLRQNYANNEPIFLSDICIPNMKDVSVRQQLLKLTADGRLKRFDTGIYFFPGDSFFSFGSTLSVNDVVKKKYLMDGSSRCGYIGGLMLANAARLTTQVPMVYDVYTNKATTKYRETKLAGIRIILRKPCVPINDENASTLQFLDLMLEVQNFAEVEGSELTKRLIQYCEAAKVNLNSVNSYLPYYPPQVYQNIYKAGLFKWDICMKTK